MQTLIVGYGRMGHEVEGYLKARGHQIVARVDTSGAGDTSEVTSELLRSAEMVIEFSLPEAVLGHARQYAAVGIPVVLGTTGWDAQRTEVQHIVEGYQSTLLWGTNFALGTHLFFALAEKAAALISGLPEYDIMLTEWHHKLKKDSPSGTALTTAERILKVLPRKKEINTGRIDRAIRDEELHVASVRGGTIPGTHSVLLDSAADSLEIRHTARNRSGLALGAVMAAEWLLESGRKGFLSVDDFVKSYFAEALG
ncbi:MAG: 4-hydroxy-tetrahydrodipicolinate reductase [Spirochaetales bacterium]|nr:4-hydroxy-tetrahydrodipicolinate reductase [Spirochaetales bacterium]